MSIVVWTLSNIHRSNFLDIFHIHLQILCELLAERNKKMLVQEPSKLFDSRFSENLQNFLIFYQNVSRCRKTRGTNRNIKCFVRQYSTSQFIVYSEVSLCYVVGKDLEIPLYNFLQIVNLISIITIVCD